MYVVLGEAADAHAPFVQRHLDEQFVFIDHSLLLAGREISYRLQPGKATVTTDDGRALRNVKAVWYRRLPHVTLEDIPVAEPTLRQYCRRATDGFTEIIHSRFAKARWVSNYAAIVCAEDKLHQLEVASRIGFAVPDTLFTSSAADARQFVQQYGIAIAKPINAGWFMRGGKNLGFYASKVTPSTNFRGLHIAPTIFQQLVAMGVDVRVAVVGDKVFAATIQSPQIDVPGSHVRDFRHANVDKHRKIIAIELPTQVARHCVQLVKELGLSFGAIDLIRDKKGKYWFLENNPCGQWAFVEHMTGQPIGKAIAQLLMTGKA